MAEPKMIKKDIVYSDVRTVYEIEINGKVVKAEKYSKQDSLLNDYEFEIEVIDKDKILTEEEHEEVYEFVEELE